MISCPFCGGDSRRQHAISIAGQSRWLLRCNNCESCFPDSPIPETLLLELYDEGYFSMAGWEVTKSRLLAADYAAKVTRLGLFHAGGPNLEIGASYGFFADVLHRRTGTAPDVLELSQGCRRHMQEHFPTLNQRGGTLDDLPETPHYRTVFAFHLLEHLPMLAVFLRQLATRMVPGGLAYFLTPNASSTSFVRLGEQWGWSCPDQHCEFLSPFIPPSFYNNLGFERVSATSGLPAAIHTPSSALVHLDRMQVRLAARRAAPVSWRSTPAKVASKFVEYLRQQLRQNDPNARLLPLERSFHRLRAETRHDELALLLRRTG